MPDPQVEGEVVENTGPDLNVIAGRIAQAMGVDIEPTASVEEIMIAILEKVSGSSGEGEGGEEGSAEVAASLRKVFDLADDANGDAILVAARTAVDKQTVSTQTVATLAKQVEGLMADKKTDEIDALIAAHTGTKINPNDPKVMAAHRRIAGMVGVAEFKQYIEAQPNILPPSGKMPGPSEDAPDSRDGIISAARRDFRAEVTRCGEDGVMTSEVNFVAQDLRDRKIPELTDKEKSTLAT